MKVGICIILIILTLLVMLYVVFQNNVDKIQKVIRYKQTHCSHDFKYVQNVWGYDGDVLMHQYECTKCGRKDYLIARDDPDKDWNHGVGDGKLCDINRQEYVRN